MSRRLRQGGRRSGNRWKAKISTQIPTQDKAAQPLWRQRLVRDIGRPQAQCRTALAPADAMWRGRPYQARHRLDQDTGRGEPYRTGRRCRGALSGGRRSQQDIGEEHPRAAPGSRAGPGRGYRERARRQPKAAPSLHAASARPRKSRNIDPPRPAPRRRTRAGRRTPRESPRRPESPRRTPGRVRKRQKREAISHAACIGRRRLRDRSALPTMVVGSVIMVGGGLVLLVMRNDPMSGGAD